MKISNFRQYRSTDSFEYATVDVTTGILWFRKTEIGRRIGKCHGSLFWRFSDTGAPVPGDYVHDEYMAYLMSREDKHEK